MNNKLLLILAVGMMIAAVGLFSWQHNGDAQANGAQPEPATTNRFEDNLTIVEFELTDGTPCVMVATRSPGRARLAGPGIPGQGGVSCNWNYQTGE